LESEAAAQVSSALLGDGDRLSWIVGHALGAQILETHGLVEAGTLRRGASSLVGPLGCDRLLGAVQF